MAERSEEYVFSDALQSRIPPDIVDAMRTSDKESFMEKVEDAEKTTWWILVQLLSLVKAECGAHTSLQLVVGDLLQFLEWSEEDPYDPNPDLFELSQKTAVLHYILARKHNSNMSESAINHIRHLTNEIKLVTMLMHTRRAEWNLDQEDVLPSLGDYEADLLRSLTQSIDSFIYDPGIETDEDPINEERGTQGDDSENDDSISSSRTSIYTTWSGSDIPPEPLFLEIPFYDPSDLEDGPERFSDNLPEPISHEINFYDPSDLEDGLDRFPEISPEPTSHEINFYDPNDLDDSPCIFPDIFPEPLSHEINFYDPSDLEDSLDRFFDILPEPLSHEINFYDPSNIPEGVLGSSEEAHDPFIN